MKNLLIGCLAVVLILWIVWRALNKTAVKKVIIESPEIRKAIPDFEEEDFLAWAEERFTKFRKSWNKGAMEELHPFETEQLFELQTLYLREAKEKGIETEMEEVSVKESGITAFSNKRDKYELVVCVKANKKGNMVEDGTEDEPCHYYLTFEKEKQDRMGSVCPCCTAPVSLNATHCEYCHTNFPAAMDRWMLAKIDVA
ncbi:MAG: TIM44-like domain-containing protein [Clostridia bacterium]|nr:TIM44-like domain-containing protein [Clostridia bacterium]